MKHINPQTTQAWQALQAHFSSIKNTHLRDLFAADPNRFDNYHACFNDAILLDYSKNRLDQTTRTNLLALADEAGLKQAIDSLFAGEKINQTENRSVLHTALRQQSDAPVWVDGVDVMPQIQSVRAKMQSFSEAVISGQWRGYKNDAITDVINIGIGGSDLGPYMVTEALKPYRNHLRMHFVSNVDASHLHEVLKQCNPQTSLFLIASKTFTTQETMTNAYTARDWFLKSAGDAAHIKAHFIALSTNEQKVKAFGISLDNMFVFWDWVGGRYSLWSAIGLSIALAVGFQGFMQLLEGAASMDEHFYHTPFEKNLPVLLGLIGIWYNNFFDCQSHAILPYEQYLHRFPAYLQQGDMESNGKSVDRNGQFVNYQTGPIIWGEPGTNGQHAFYQLMHQGSKLIPCDFIACARPQHHYQQHHTILLANVFAQSRALAFGQTRQDILHELETQAMDTQAAQWLSTFKVCAGNRPSNTILLSELTPKTLGALIAMYEHKIFTQGVIWNIFSFDQWGVELGKQLAKQIESNLTTRERVAEYDSSTNGLINAWKTAHFDSNKD